MLENLMIKFYVNATTDFASKIDMTTEVNMKSWKMVIILLGSDDEDGLTSQWRRMADVKRYILAYMLIFCAFRTLLKDFFKSFIFLYLQKELETAVNLFCYFLIEHAPFVFKRLNQAVFFPADVGTLSAGNTDIWQEISMNL